MALKKNLDVMIQEKLYEEVICGNWKPGQALNLDELAASFDVSRTPVLQALKRMHTLGMVSVSSQGHFSVMSFDEKQVRDIFEIRLLLERQALSDLEDHGIEPDCALLKKINDVHTFSDQRGDMVQTRRADLNFHRQLVAQASNQCLSDLYNKVQGQFMVANYLQARHTPDQQRLASDEHEMILAAMESGDYATARSRLEGHIQRACEKVIEKMNA